MPSGFPLLCLWIRNDPTKTRVNFRYLKRVTSKDEYPMPIDDMLINDALGHKVINILDGNAVYNQIFMLEKDLAKTKFRHRFCWFLWVDSDELRAEEWWCHQGRRQGGRAGARPPPTHRPPHENTARSSTVCLYIYKQDALLDVHN
jgi:hypothetical protein